MDRIENKLCSFLRFGATHSSKAEAELVGYSPSLWDVCHDLDNYIKQGLLFEIPVSCSLKEIFESEKLLSDKNRPYNRILRQDYLNEDMVIRFKTIPDGTMYELLFSKDDRTAHSGYFKRLP